MNIKKTLWGIWGIGISLVFYVTDTVIIDMFLLERPLSTIVTAAVAGVYFWLFNPNKFLDTNKDRS